MTMKAKKLKPDTMITLAAMLVTLPILATPTYVNSGSASTTCALATDQAVTFVEQSNGTTLTCPDGYIGAGVWGGAGGLNVQGTLSGHGPQASYSFSGQMTDTITETNGV